MSATYHLLVADIASASDHDLRTILAAADISRETFRTLWRQHDFRHLVLTQDDAVMVWNGFVGFLDRYVANGDPIHPLIVSPGEFALLKISCADGLPLLRPYKDQEPQPFPEISEEMSVMSGLYHIARLREEMAQHYTRLHYITDVKDSDEVQKLRNYFSERWSGWHSHRGAA